MMAFEKSQGASSFSRMGQTPVDTYDGEATVVDPTIDSKTFPLPTTQREEPVPPPAYSDNSGTPISEFPSIPGPSSRPSHLQKPIAIPAIDVTFDSPFLRAYPPVLKDYNLPKESFMSFLDNLNQVVKTSPPLQVLDAAGGILGSVPILFPLWWVGSMVSGLANLGGLGVSKGRTELAIRQANKDIFGPRGLKLEIAKLDALAHVAGIPILDSRGKVNRLAPPLQPLTMHANGDEDSLDGQQRRLRCLQPWIADLELDTLPWTSKSKLTRLNATLKKRSGNARPDDRSKLAEHQRLADERDRKLARALENFNRTMFNLDNEEEEARSQSRDSASFQQRSSSIARDRSRSRKQYNDEAKRITDEFTAEDPEGAGIRKTLWLVIRDIDASSGTAGQSANLSR